jgi:hypothetical protein
MAFSDNLSRMIGPYLCFVVFSSVSFCTSESRKWPFENHTEKIGASITSKSLSYSSLQVLYGLMGNTLITQILNFSTNPAKRIISLNILTSMYSPLSVFREKRT